jgi:alpha/beta superfamily hydrolase
LLRTSHINFGDHMDLDGEIIIPQTSHATPGAILCHGLASGKGAVRGAALELAKQEITTIIFDLRGHGHSKGTFNGRAYEDVIAAWKWLSQYQGRYLSRQIY